MGVAFCFYGKLLVLPPPHTGKTHHFRRSSTSNSSGISIHIRMANHMMRIYQNKFSLWQHVLCLSYSKTFESLQGERLMVRLWQWHDLNLIFTKHYCTIYIPRRIADELVVGWYRSSQLLKSRVRVITPKSAISHSQVPLVWIYKCWWRLEKCFEPPLHVVYHIPFDHNPRWSVVSYTNNSSSSLPPSLRTTRKSNLCTMLQSRCRLTSDGTVPHSSSMLC